MHTFAQSLRSSVRQLATVAAACSLAALTACGGGGGGSDGATPSGAGRADAYVGTWKVKCAMQNTISSVSVTLVITKASANQGTVKGSWAQYNSADCSGAVVSSDSWTETDTIVGTKTVDGKLVDKIEVTDSHGGYKDIGYIQGNTLQYSDDSNSTDAEGFPTALDGSMFVFVKQ